MDELILARHGESLYSALGRLNGDPSLPCPLTPTGVDQARQLGALLGGAQIELWSVTEFERTVQTAAQAHGGGAAPIVIGELNDPRYGRYEGATLEAYREWSFSAPSQEPSPGGGESRVEVVARYARGLELLLARPERCVAAIAHSLPIAYVLGAAQGATPRPRTELVAYATPYRLESAMVERAVAVLAGWLTAPDW